MRGRGAVLVPEVIVEVLTARAYVTIPRRVARAVAGSAGEVAAIEHAALEQREVARLGAARAHSLRDLPFADLAACGVPVLVAPDVGARHELVEVAAQEFVAALSQQDHLEVGVALVRERMELVFVELLRGDGRELAAPEHAPPVVGGEGIDGHVERDLVIRQAERRRDLGGRRRVAVLDRAPAAHAERRERAVPGGERRDHRRIDATREKHAAANVRHEAQPDAVVEQVAKPFLVCLIGLRRRVVTRGNAPVRRNRDPTGFEVERQHRPGRHALDALEMRRQLAHRCAREEPLLEPRAPVERAPDAGVREKRLDLRSEDERPAPVRPRVEERLDAEAVAREDEPSPCAIEQRHREHAVDRIEEALAAFEIEIRNHLAVRLRAKEVAVRERGANLAMVVDLPVDHRGDAAVRGGHGLHAALEVDDGQALEDEADVVPGVDRLAVGPAVADGGAHGGEHEPVRVVERTTVEMNESGYAAHAAIRRSDRM